MKFIGKLAKLLGISLAILLLFLSVSDFAYARGGCFGKGTKISTPRGDKPIEQLHQGDRVISYNFTTHHSEVGEIGKIEVFPSPDYFVINKTLKVTGTHPFYIQTSTGTDLIEVRELKVGDRLVGENIATPIISAIEHINKSIPVYNLISINPQHNFYANKILVHNKGGGGGGHGGGHGGNSFLSTIDNIFFFLASVFILLVSIMLDIAKPREEFTNNLDLINFTKLVNPKFIN